MLGLAEIHIKMRSIKMISIIGRVDNVLESHWCSAAIKEKWTQAKQAGS